MTRATFKVRLGRLLQRLPFFVFRPLERIVGLCEARNYKCPPIFVLALPRSGSTLTYQLICHTFSVRYLSNLWNLLYQLPYLGCYLSERHCLNYRSNFISNNGFVSGLDGPAEGLRFWSYWMCSGLNDESSVVRDAKTFTRRSSYLRKIIARARESDPPFVSGYLGHSLIPDRLRMLFPDGIYIRLRRHPLSNALSLLESTRRSGRTWFSVLPNQCKAYDGASEHERVAAQVYWLNRRLDSSELARSWLSISYESICENPSAEMLRIRAFFNSRGVVVALKDSQIPERFNSRSISDIDMVDRCLLDSAFRKLILKHGPLIGYDTN